MAEQNYMQEQTSMIVTTHSARVLAAIRFLKANGKRGSIPLGPCVLEQDNEGSVTVFWGRNGEITAMLTEQETSEALLAGSLVLLD